MKKGFTLIEMVGVMVILSLLMLFAMPNIINYIKKGGDTKDAVVKTLVYDAASKYINDNKNMFKQDPKNTYCISLYTLAKEGYVESPIVLSGSDEDITNETTTKSVKVTYDKKYKYELTDECIGIVNPTPVLYSGLTPVMYDGNNWVVANPKSDEWYNYDKQMWANAVVLGSGKTKKPGEVVTVEGDNPDALMMLVWIPRYEYKIEGQYGTHSNGVAGSKMQPGEIKINFIGNESLATQDYIIHPAFTFGDQEISGFWVGKFQISNTNNSSTVSNIRILPNVVSLRNKSVSQFFIMLKNIEDDKSTFGIFDVDTHMIKNSEWGAIAYLSQSKYGKYGNTDYEGEKKRIYINNSKGYYTGRSGGNVLGKTAANDTYITEESTEQNNKYGYYTYDGYLLNFNTNDKMTIRDIKKGTGASTTGNIYGVYDMCGGAWDFVMGVYEDSSGIYSGKDFSKNSGFNGKIDNGNDNIINGISFPPRKYYDSYTLNIKSACNDRICYGHALSETVGWYNSTSNMVNKTNPWIVRGGDVLYADIFSFSYYSGNSYNNGSTHFVALPK